MKKILKHLKEDWYKYIFESIVVITGILLAFNLSSWRLLRIQKRVEIRILEEIKESLKKDTVDLNGFIMSMEKSAESIEIIQKQFGGKQYRRGLDRRSVRPGSQEILFYSKSNCV